MSASNDELLFKAAKSGDMSKVKELLSKGTGTGYRDEVIYYIFKLYLLLSIILLLLLIIIMMMLMCVASIIFRIENNLYICLIYFLMYNLCLKYTNNNSITFDNDDHDL